MTAVDLFHGMVKIRILRHNIVDINDGKVLEDIQQALGAGVISLDDLHGRRLVFDSLCEGHGEREMRAVAQSLREQSWFDTSRSVFLHNVFDPITADIKHVAWPWYMVDHSGWLSAWQSLPIDWNQVTRDRWFICMMRRPSEQRSRFFRIMRDRFHIDTYRVSYASMIDHARFDPIAGIDLPVLLDGPTPGIEQHRATDPRIFRCLTDLIVESSNQEAESSSWTSTYASEKTFKCFAWHQIPIWYAAPGHVAHVRNLGFDTFDDLMQSHAYDMVSDPAARADAVLDTLQDFLRMHVDLTPDQLSQRIWPRLRSNHRLLVDYHQRRISHWPIVIQDLKNV